MVSSTTVLGLTTFANTDTEDLVTHVSTGLAARLESLFTGAAAPTASLTIDFNSASNRTLTIKNAGAGTGGLVVEDSITLTNGPLTVSAGGIAVTGNSTITGTLGGLTGLTIASGGITVTAGGITVTAGGVKVSAGNLGVGSAALSTAVAFTMNGVSLTGAVNQWGALWQPTYDSGATSNARGLEIAESTAAVVFTLPERDGIRISDLTKGAGSVVTTNVGLRIMAQTAGGTNNYGLYVEAPSGGATLNIGAFIDGDVKWGQALVALGGGAAPTLGTIGGSGPAAAAQNTWKKFVDSTGANFFVPVWK